MFKSKSLDNQQPTVSILAAGMVVTGNIDTKGDIRIDGTLKGNIKSEAKIIVGPEGLIEGDIIARNSDIMGKVDGKIKVGELLHLKGKAEVTGDIHAMKLVVEPTANFNGQCKMGANVVELREIARAVNE